MRASAASEGCGDLGVRLVLPAQPARMEFLPVQGGATLVNYANAGIRWETTEQVDVGLEFSLFQGRFTTEIDWYRRFTYDILSDLPIPAYVGSGSNPFVNAAQVENTGWDFTLQWRETKGRVTYNIGAILSPVQNKVLAINEGKSEIFDAGTAQGDFATRTVVGQPDRKSVV
jgi:outer membrane receptor protein involved in Fe transport